MFVIISNQGACFGGGPDIAVYSDFISKDSLSNFPGTYQDILGKGLSIFTGDLDNNNHKFKILEIEVFKIFK